MSDLSSDRLSKAVYVIDRNITRQVARGKSSVAYRMRAEIPGLFSALPTRAYAMYAPELRGNSDEIKLVIRD